MHSFFSGLGGSFIAAGIVFPMSEWTLDIEISEIDVTNFKSAGGWREFLNGFKSGRITAKGPFDPTGFDGVGMLPLGAPITLTCGIGGAYSLTVRLSSPKATSLSALRVLRCIVSKRE